MARAFSMKDAAERLDKFPAMLTHEGEAPVVAILRREHPVLAVLPWDLYIGLLQTLASLPDDIASPQREGIRALLADTTIMAPPEPSTGKPAGASTAPSQHRPPHRRRPAR
jgi:hypothetical protein